MMPIVSFRQGCGSERIEELLTGLYDRRRGKPSPKRGPLKTVEEVLGLYTEKYFDLNVVHFHENPVFSRMLATLGRLPAPSVSEIKMRRKRPMKTATEVAKLALCAWLVLVFTSNVVGHVWARQTSTQTDQLEQEPTVETLMDDLKQALVDRKQALSLSEMAQLEALDKTDRAAKALIENLGRSLQKPDKDRADALVTSMRKVGISVVIKGESAFVRFPKEYWGGRIKY